MHVLHYVRGTNNFIVEVDENSSIEYKESSLFIDSIGVIDDVELIAFRNSKMTYNSEKVKTALQTNIRSFKNHDDYEMKLIFDDDTVKTLLVKNLSLKYLIFQSLISIFVDKKD